MLDRHLEKLRTFHAVSSELSMVRASRRLAISQPAVSKSVRTLEQIIGQALFVRSRSGLSLTPAGKRLQIFATRLFAEVADLSQELAHADEVAGVVRAGTYQTLGEVIWPGALERLRRLHPKLLIQLETGSAGSLKPKLRSGALDMIVEAEPEVESGFTSKVLYKDEFQLFGPKGKANAPAGATLPISYVESAVDRQGRSIREHLDRLRIPHELRFSTESFPFTRSLVESGACFGVLPRSLAERSAGRFGIEPYLRRGAPVIFGEHRLCATYPEHADRSAKVSAIVAAIKVSRGR
jgi:LysR family pca operon transcriptional activator